MKKVYCSQSFPTVTTMLLDRERRMTETLLRDELERLISMEQQHVAINQVKDLLAIMDYPSDKKELLEMMMQSDEIYNLLIETQGTMMVLADEDMIEEYEEKTLYSFLIDLTNWLETR